MKLRPILSLAFLFGIFVLCTSGKESPEIIYWSDSDRLEWADFAGEPRYDYQSIAALTSSGIVHYKGCENGKIKYKVRAYFEKNESWVKDEARTEHHLIHEQIHFDITELYARKLRKILAERNFSCADEQAFEDCIKAFLDNWQYEQQSFDIYSRHSLDAHAQKEWYYKVEMELSLLNDYKE
ncbi:MAG TPA: hypothetical protein ENJ45_02565 [Phaeodactylibacter sp.]|nr:hypothetical protein [Phaeodactylibacter sp.]